MYKSYDLHSPCILYQPLNKYVYIPACLVRGGRRESRLSLFFPTQHKTETDFLRGEILNSKQKGKRFELALAAKIREYGFEARRTAQYCGNTGDASDVVGLPGIHIEAKHQEQMRLYEWMEQAVRDHTTGTLPAVFHKKNNADILVTMRFEDWMTLYSNSDLPDGGVL